MCRTATHHLNVFKFTVLTKYESEPTLTIGARISSSARCDVNEMESIVWKVSEEEWNEHCIKLVVHFVIYYCCAVDYPRRNQTENHCECRERGQRREFNLIIELVRSILVFEFQLSVYLSVYQSMLAPRIHHTQHTVNIHGWMRCGVVGALRRVHTPAAAPSQTKRT